MMVIKFIRVLILLLLLTSGYSMAQNGINTSFKYSEHKIFIFYQFAGDSSSEYNIAVVLKRTSDPGFRIEPNLLSGDFREGIYANTKREIIWHLTQQEEIGLTGNDYYFEITANEIKEGGGIAWYVYVGGIIVGGGAAAVLLLKKNNATTTANSSFTFPTPPERPN